MAYRKLDSIDEKIIQTVIELGAQVGVNGVTGRLIASKLGISTYLIFNHFKTKQNYLDEGAIYIDTPRMQETLTLTKEHLPLEEIWDYMIDDFILNKNETLYYISYTNTFGFDPTENNKRSETFIEIANSIFDIRGDYTLSKKLLLWDYITTMVMYYAEKIISGFIPNTKEKKDELKAIVFFGLSEKK